MSQSPPRPRLFIGGLPESIERQALREMIQKQLSNYGEVVDLKLMSTYGFVEFSTVQDAVDVVNTFQQIPFLNDHRIRIEYSQPLGMPSRRRVSLASSSESDSMPESPTFPTDTRGIRLRHPVLVTGIKIGTCWQQLKDFGRLAGQVAFCDLDRRDPRRGFIEYLLEEDALLATKDLDGRMLNGAFVNVALHQSARKAVSSRRSRSPSPEHSRRSRSPSRSRRHRHRPSSHPYPSRQTQEYTPSQIDVRALISQSEMFRNLVTTYDPTSNPTLGQLLTSFDSNFTVAPEPIPASAPPPPSIPSASYNATLLSALRQQRLLADAFRAIAPQQPQVGQSSRGGIQPLLMSNVDPRYKA